MPLQPSSRSSETRTATLVQPSAARTWHPAWLLAGILLLYCIWTFVGWRRYLINQGIPFTTLSLTFFVLFDWAFWLVGAPAVWWISKQFPPTDVARFLVLHLPLSLLAATAAALAADGVSSPASSSACSISRCRSSASRPAMLRT